MANLPVYNIEFSGYKLDQDVEKLPTDSGVYIIYRCVYNKTTDKVQLVELIYIGKATSLRQEVAHHKRREEFLAEAGDGETLCYAYAIVPRVQYDIIENALIYTTEPRLNTNLVDNYDHQDAEFHFSGRCDKLEYYDFKIVDGVILEL